MDWNQRTKMLLNEEQYEKMSSLHILVCGLGGVGGFAAESLVRFGFQHLTICDCDTVNSTNRNRQIIALKSTTDLKKVDVMSARLKDINPELNLHSIDTFLSEDNIPQILASNKFHYIIDAIDTLLPKTVLIESAVKQNIPIISSMGSGAKFDPSLIKVVDIAKTSKCPLAKRIRERLKKVNIYTGVKVVCSIEDFDKSKFVQEKGMSNKRTIVGSTSYIPPMFGGFCVATVIRDLLDL